MNVYDQMNESVSIAKQTLSAADKVATQMATMVEGRLRKVGSTWVLSKLKRELRDYNIHTGRWSNK